MEGRRSNRRQRIRREFLLVERLAQVPWTHSKFVFESPAKMRGTVEAPRKRDVRDRLIGVGGIAQILAASGQPHPPDLIGHRCAFRLKDLVHIALGAMDGRRDLGNR